MKNLKNLFNGVFVISFILLFVGCGKSQKVVVTAFSSAKSSDAIEPGASFKIVPVLNNALKGNPLLAEEISRKIESMLTARGFKVNHLWTADYQLSFVCGMTSRTVTVNVPIYLPYSYGSCGYYSSCRGCYGYGCCNGSYTFVPEERTYFNKKIELTVTRPGVFFNKTVWNAFATFESESSDYRNDVDTLIEKSFEYFGKSSK